MMQALLSVEKVLCVNTYFHSLLPLFFKSPHSWGIWGNPIYIGKNVENPASPNFSNAVGTAKLWKPDP